MHIYNFYLLFPHIYIPRLIDKYLKDWGSSPKHKPLLLRSARQVGKSRAIEHLGESFDSFVKIDFEKKPEFCNVFSTDRDVTRIVPILAALTEKSIIPGKTLLFLDEIQECPEAIMSLRYFWEDMPELHVVGAGSLLEFALHKLPTFGVARIHSMYMYPFTFDEFLVANGCEALCQLRNTYSPSSPLPDPMYSKPLELFRWYIIIGVCPKL